MTRLRPGDRVDCRVRNNNIVKPDSADYEEIHTFEVIGEDTTGYYLYIPSYINLSGTVPIDENACIVLDINNRFVGEHVTYIKDNMIAKAIYVSHGIACLKCYEFYQYAEPNQLDNKGFICWVCRNHRFYK